MKWYRKLHRGIKKVWDENFRPAVEPVLRMVIGAKVTKELDRHK